MKRNPLLGRISQKPRTLQDYLKYHIEMQCNRPPVLSLDLLRHEVVARSTGEGCLRHILIRVIVSVILHHVPMDKAYFMPVHRMNSLDDLGQVGVSIMTYRVFISHSNNSLDWERVGSLERWLLNMGIMPLLARRVFQPQQVVAKVQSMIDTADAVIVFLTESAAASGFVNQEIGYAHNKKPIVMLRDLGVSMTGFVYGLDAIELKLKGVPEEVERLRSWLLEEKATKEIKNAIIGGLVAFAIGFGFSLWLFGAARE